MRPTKYAVGYASVTQGDLYVETMGVYDDMETAKARLEEVKEDLLREHTEEDWSLKDLCNGFELYRPYDEDAIQVAISEINHARQV